MRKKKKVCRKKDHSDAQKNFKTVLATPGGILGLMGMCGPDPSALTLRETSYYLFWDL